MPAEFDAYAQEYAEQLRDPLRDHFSSGDEFFARRKILLLQDFFRRRGSNTQALRWMDLGCGQGDLLRLGQPSFAAVAGCDLSAAMISKCEHLNVRHQESPDQLPFRSDSFDLVTAVCVYHHVETALRPALTREAMRVLKPGGIFCIIEHNPFNPMTQLIVRRSPVDEHACLLTARTAARLLRGCDARVIETRYFLYFPKRVYDALAKLENQLSRICLGGQFAVFARKP